MLFTIIAYAILRPYPFFNFYIYFVTPEGFTTVVANEGLEKARAYLNQVPPDWRLYIPSKGCSVKPQVETPSDYTYSLFWAELSRLLGEKSLLL